MIGQIVFVFGALILGVTSHCTSSSKYPVGNPNDCSAFEICYNDLELSYTCPDGFLFNHVNHQCDVSESSGCIKAHALDPECSDDLNVSFKPDPSSCNSYYMCIDGVKHLMICGRGLHYNHRKQTCNLPEFSDCPLTTEPTTTTEEPGTELPPGAIDPELCPEGTDIYFQPNETDCTKYYQCIDGRRYDYTCPDEYHFNPEKLACDLPEYAGCTVPAEPHPDCPLDASNKPQPDPYNCTNFYLCVDGSKLEYSCGEGWYFNPETMLCDVPEAEGCDLFTEPPTEPPLCPAGSDYEKFPHPWDCQSYFMCFKGEVLLAVCPDYLYYNDAIKNCDNPENVDCTATTTVSPPGEEENCPPGSDFEMFPYPWSCDLYYMCLDGDYLVGECPGDLHFNPELKRCDRSESANCTSIATTEETTTTTEEPIPSTPTQPITTTTEEPTTTTEEPTTTTEEPTTTTEEPTTTTEEPTTTTEEPTTTTEEPTTTTEEPTTTTEIQVCAAGDFHKVPHPYDCSRYFQCMDDEQLPGYCVDGLHFNPELQKCDNPENVGCTPSTTTERFY